MAEGITNIIQNPYDANPHRKSSDFQKIQGSKIKKQKDRHQKGLDIREKDEKRLTQMLIEEGIDDYFDPLILDNIFDYDFYDDPDDWRSEAEERGIDVISEEHKQEHEFLKPPFDSKTELKELVTLFKTPPSSENDRSLFLDKISKFEKKQIRQALAVSRIIRKLWTSIHKNPSDIDALYSILSDERSDEILTRKQVFSIRCTITEYLWRHDLVEDTACKYPDPQGFFLACFGKKPQERIEVVKKPINIHIRCFNEDDYAIAYMGNTAIISEEDKNRARKSGGATLSSVNLPELKDVVTIENASQNKAYIGKVPVVVDSQISSETEDHEEQHVFNTLFIPFKDFMTEEAIIANALESTVRHSKVREKEGKPITDEEKLKVFKDRILHQMVRFQRRRLGIDKNARDEIIAYYQDGRRPRDIDYILINSPLYDYKEYFKDYIQYIPDYIRSALKQSEYIEDLKSLGIDPSEISDDEIQPYIDLVLDTEYKRDLQKWISVLPILDKKGYEHDEIISLLYQYPVNSWVALARRIPSKTYSFHPY